VVPNKRGRPNKISGRIYGKGIKKSRIFSQVKLIFVLPRMIFINYLK
jgi:hypothetical protein